MKEYYCKENSCILNEQYCPNDRYCKDGACVQQTTCTDSDGGKNYYVYGTITTHDDLVSFEDSCCYYCETAPTSSGPYLREFWCENGIAETTVYTCPNGCSDGACIEEKCVSGTYRCDETGYYVQKCDSTTGKWVNGEYCPGKCFDGRCASSIPIIPTSLEGYVTHLYLSVF